MKESRRLRLGFIPLNDAAPLIAARARGFFAEEGLEVELSREVSWATIRDKIAVGALDGAHLLAPMAAALAPGGEALVALRVLARAGAAVVLARSLADSDDPAAALRLLTGRRRAEGGPPPTFAVVHPQALHNYLLRRWLAETAPADVQIIVAPPSRMAELLAEGVIEGFSAGEPWNTAAVGAGAGAVVARAADVWPRAPDKVLVVRETLVHDRPEAMAALARAIDHAAGWCVQRGNAADLASLLSAPTHIGLAPDLLARSLQATRLATGEAANPSEADAVWLVDQMDRSGQLDGAAAAAAHRVFRSVPTASA